MTCGEVIRLGSRLVITIVGALAGCSKIAHGYDSNFWTPESLYYLTAVAEILVSGAIWIDSLVCWVARTIMLCCLAIVVALPWWPAARSCGCFGAWETSRQAHLAVVSVLGMASALLVSKHRDRCGRKPGAAHP